MIDKVGSCLQNINFGQHEHSVRTLVDHLPVVAREVMLLAISAARLVLPAFDLLLTTDLTRLVVPSQPQSLSAELRSTLFALFQEILARWPTKLELILAGSESRLLDNVEVIRRRFFACSSSGGAGPGTLARVNYFAVIL